MLSDRQRLILRLIVEHYIHSAAPVASETVARLGRLRVSSATVRNEVAYLEENGYLRRPHPSSGCIPLDNAYRLYVETLAAAETERIPSDTQQTVRKQLSDVEQDVDGWAETGAVALAQLVNNLAIATFPKTKPSRVRHLELVHLQEFLALLIVVIEQASLRRQLVRLQTPVYPAQIEETATRVKRQLIGLTRREIETLDIGPLSPLEETVMETTALILEEEDQAAYSEHHVDGLRNLLSHPEFTTGEETRAVVGSVEDGSLVEAVLGEQPEDHVVRVVIGQEHQGDVLVPYSVVICQYGIPGEAEGMIGAVGPTRMPYSRTISSVKFVSSVMSELVTSVKSS